MSAEEIELAGETNTRIGAWQAVKYRALACLEKGFALDSPGVTAVLVAHSVPRNTQRFCERYGVSWFEIMPR